MQARTLLDEDHGEVAAMFKHCEKHNEEPPEQQGGEESMLHLLWQDQKKKLDNPKVTNRVVELHVALARLPTAVRNAATAAGTVGAAVRNAATAAAAVAAVGYAASAGRR